MAQIEVPEIPARQLIQWTLGVMAVVVAFWLVFRFQQVVLLLLAAIILSVALRPGVTYLERRGVGRSVAFLVIFILLGLLLALLIWYALPILARQGTAMTDTLAQGYRHLRQDLRQLPNIVVGHLLAILPAQLPLPEMVGQDLANGDSELTAAAVAEQGRRLGASVLQIVVVIHLSYGWTIQGDRIKKAALLLIPLEKRTNMRQLVDEIETKVSAYVLGQGVLCLGIGAAAFVAYTLIGLPHALLLAILAGLLEAIPLLGPILGAVPAMIVGLSIAPGAALWVILATIVIQQLENSYLVPRVMHKAIGVRPLVTLLALLAFGSQYGILGALIALPLAAVIQLLLERYLLTPAGAPPAAPGRDQLSVLRYQAGQLVNDVRNQIRRKEVVPTALSDELEDELEAIVQDLETFLLIRGETNA